VGIKDLLDNVFPHDVLSLKCEILNVAQWFSENHVLSLKCEILNVAQWFSENQDARAGENIGEGLKIATD
jgi:hypothetical protein